MAESPLEQLARASGREFPTLFAARKKTRDELPERRRRLATLPHDDGVSIVLRGSWGRAEPTSGSDDDFMVLVKDRKRQEIVPSIEEVKNILPGAQGDQGIFEKPVFSHKLIQRIGLQKDKNNNLTRRMLFLLESVPATGDHVYQAVRDQLLNRYLDESIKDDRPPRFLLNDVIRYWRTVCVDFAGKEHQGHEKWGIRNAKLRTSRKILFAGGLLPVLECHQFSRNEISDFLPRQFGMPPTDRIAEAFLNHQAADAGGRTLGAYDNFLALLDDKTKRKQLESVTRESSKTSEVFEEACRLGKELQQGLLALLFETRGALPKLIREYGIF